MARVGYRSCFSLCLVGVFTYAIVEAWDMPLQARLFPLTVGFIALALLAWQIVAEVTVRPSGATVDGPADFGFTADEATARGRRMAVEMFGWIYGLILGLWLLGYHVAIPLMVLLYLLRHREGKVLAATLTVGIWLVLWGVFDRLLYLPFPEGQIFEWLGWG